MSAKFSKKQAFVFGWEHFKKNWKFLIPLLIIVFVVTNIVSNIGISAREQHSAFGFLFQIILFILNAIIGVGLIRIFLSIQDGKKPHFRMMVDEYQKAWRYFLASFLYGIIIIIGLIFLIIPGIYLAIKFQFFMYFIVDKNSGILESFEKSSKITRGNMMNLFLFGLIAFGISIIGFLAFGFGLLVTIPVVAIATAHIYRKLEA